MAMSAAQAFAPGSPAGDAVGAAAGMLGLTSSIASISPIPSLAVAQASGAGGESNSGFNNRGFDVNLGSGSAGGSSHWLLILGAAAVAAIAAGWRP